jgi:hypothetical protein
MTKSYAVKGCAGGRGMCGGEEGTDGGEMSADEAEEGRVSLGQLICERALGYRVSAAASADTARLAHGRHFAAIIPGRGRGIGCPAFFGPVLMREPVHLPRA